MAKAAHQARAARYYTLQAQPSVNGFIQEPDFFVGEGCQMAENRRSRDVFCSKMAPPRENEQRAHRCSGRHQWHDDIRTASAVQSAEQSGMVRFARVRDHRRLAARQYSLRIGTGELA